MEEYSSHIPKLVEAIGDGKNCSWRKNKFDPGGNDPVFCCVRASYNLI